MQNGTIGWLAQRLSALILLAYTGFWVYFFWCHPDVDYAVFSAFFGTLSARIFTTLAALALVGHAWIGLWAISTDYMTERMLGGIAVPLRLLFLLGVWLALFIYAAVLLAAVWS